MSNQLGVEILNDGGRVILTIKKNGFDFEVDIIADDDGLAVTIARDSVICTECGFDYAGRHDNESQADDAILIDGNYRANNCGFQD